MNSNQLSPQKSIFNIKIQPQLMKPTYKKVHHYLFDFDLLIGKGSFSKVYKGINLITNQEVAVKVVQMASINSPKLNQLLLQQIDILLKVKHLNLIKCLEVLSSTKNTYIIMQLCSSDLASVCDFMQKQQKEKKADLQQQNSKFILIQNQQKRLNNNSIKIRHQKQKNKYNQKVKDSNRLKSVSSINSISSTQSVQIQERSQQDANQRQQRKQMMKEEKLYPYIKQIFLGLEYLSNLKIVHRDLKLSNILLAQNKICKIADFGFATIIPQNQTQIKDNFCIGSPLYMSPESYLSNVYSLKSDIWSFGILLFEMVFGHPPLWNCSSHQILVMEIKKPIRFYDFEKIATISSQLRQVLEGCLQVDVKKRLSVAELKSTRLIKKLFYQPMESKVVVNSRKTRGIDESNVQVHSYLFKNEILKTFDKNNDLLSNFSTIQKVNTNKFTQQNKQSTQQYINLLKRYNQAQIRKQQKCQTNQTINHSFFKIYEGLQNNSKTDRVRSINKEKQNMLHQKQILKNQSFMFRQDDQKNKITQEINFKNHSNYNLSFQEKKTGVTNLLLSYKNREQMQRILKELRRNKQTIKKEEKKLNIKTSNQKLVTFNKLPDSMKSQKQNETQKVFPQQIKSKGFGHLQNSKQLMLQPQTDKLKSEIPKKLNLNKTPQSPLGQKSIFVGSRQGNQIMFLNGINHNFSCKSYPINQTKYKFYFDKQQRNSITEEKILYKNLSEGNFCKITRNSISQEPIHFQQKFKMLEKCTSSPKFDIYKNNLTNTDKYQNLTQASSYFNPLQNKISPTKVKIKKSPFENFSDLNKKQELLQLKLGKTDESIKKYQENKNIFLAQFSTKLKQNSSHIQKKTYWKRNYGGKMTTNPGQKQKYFKQNINEQGTFRGWRQNIPINTGQRKQQRDYFGKICGLGEEKILQLESNKPFRLIMGELIIKDICGLVDFTRLLHKISFMTQRNGYSLLFVEYSIQILQNVFEKCENSEVKYHYNSSSKNSKQIKHILKENQTQLDRLALLNKKQCYLINKQISHSHHHNTSNKTIHLKQIILSYIQKYKQRRQAFNNLFQCNTQPDYPKNKLKDYQLGNLSFQKASKDKKMNLNSQRGFTNFSKLQKALSQVRDEIIEKQRLHSHFGHKYQGQYFNPKFMIVLGQIILDTVIQCIHEGSFLNFNVYFERLIKMLHASELQFFTNFSKSSTISSRLLIERFLEAYNDLRNQYQINQENFPKDNEMMSKNMSFFIDNRLR